ncbi:Mut7-C RNAse domain-containing protein, partial [Verrucomicrobiota bacterium]
MKPCVPEIRFMVDHMVIKLGKYLRILGYDAFWDKKIRTHELITRANAESRVFLTRNTHLGEQYPNPVAAFVLKQTDSVEQVRAVVLEFQLDMRARLFSKCIRCNVMLVPVKDAETVRPLVHPNVFARHREFFSCPKCHTVFWKGSHERRIFSRDDSSVSQFDS